jgi:hypothetical protein
MRTFRRASAPDTAREAMLVQILDQVVHQPCPLADPDALGRRRDAGCIEKRLGVGRDGDRLAVTIGFMDDALRQRCAARAAPTPAGTKLAS